MDATAYHLEARTPFHFGLRGVGIEATLTHGPSDTIFAGLCYAVRQLFGLGTLEEFLGGYSAPDPPAVISSAYPYVLSRGEEEVGAWRAPATFQPEKAIRLFPRPLDTPPGVQDHLDDRKRIKKIDWVSETIFRAWLRGDAATLARDWFAETDRRGKRVASPNLIQGDTIWLTAGELGLVAGWRDPETDAVRLWAVGEVPRVTVDRQASSSAVYQAGRVWFQPGGGLWLLVRWREDWRQRGELALQVLGDGGMGGERSAGHGQFKLHGPHKLGAFSQAEPGGRFLTLSLYYPTRAELSTALGGDAISYRLLVRRGWMASPDSSSDDKGNVWIGGALRRRAVRMLAEGSVLYWPGGDGAPGALADVTPEAFKAHRVWRYGLAYAMGYHPEGGGL